MVEVHYQNRLGNRLFQYCMGRILAEGLGYELAAAPLDGFAATREPVRGWAHERPAYLYRGHRIPVESILLDRSPRRIVLAGWFQNYRYYAPHADRIRRWLEPEPGRDTAASADHGEDLLLHVRLGDLVPLGQSLSVDYYRTLLRTLPHRRAFVLSDEPDHPTVQTLVADGAALLEAGPGPADVLRAARGFGRLVVGHGTFGWWMAFLSDAREVHVGIPERHEIGSFSVTRIADGLDLRVDEDRYSYYYRAPLIGEPRQGVLTPLGNFCGFHAKSKAFLWE